MASSSIIPATWRAVTGGDIYAECRAVSTHLLHRVSNGLGIKIVKGIGKQRFDPICESLPLHGLAFQMGKLKVHVGVDQARNDCHIAEVFNFT